MTDWDAWNPEPPPGAPAEVWARVVRSAAAFMADPDAPRRPCRTPDEAYWQGRADGMALGERMPEDQIEPMVALHRRYLLPGVEQDPAA